MSELRTRQWRPAWPCPVPEVLAQQRRGAGDPTQRTDATGRIWRALGTPEGPATVCVTSVASAGVVEATGWGPGSDWALETLPALLGAEDDPSGFVGHHSAVSEGLRRNPHWRLGRTNRIMEALVASVLEQKVTGKQAFGSFRELVTRHGQPAPGPGAEVGLFVQPSPQTIAAIPSWEWLKLGVDPARSRTLVSACRLADSVERIASAPHEADRRLRSIPGIGQWTSAEVRKRSLGDIDAVSFGDYHLAKQLGWAFLGHDITDDELGVILQPYTPQRGRAVAMAYLGGQARPRRGPRMSVPPHLPRR